jgi:hypothetical protein
MMSAERVDDLYRRMCSRKIAYDTVREASQVAARMRHYYPAEHLQYYLCDFCALYHVGHSRKSDRRI